jgi:uncharacterized protein YrrD
MRVGREFINKPIFSITDGKHLGSVKDLYLDLETNLLNGLFLGQEGLIKRKARLINREHVAVLGIDAVLVTDSDVVTDDNELVEAQTWLKREDLQGRDVDTAGGTKVGTIGDVLFDEEAKIVGYSLSRVHVTGPVAEHRVILNQAVVDNGGSEGIMTVDLAKAEQPIEKPAEAAEEVTPPEEAEPVVEVEIDEEAPAGEEEQA